MSITSEREPYTDVFSAECVDTVYTQFYGKKRKEATTEDLLPSKRARTRRLPEISTAAEWTCSVTKWTYFSTILISSNDVTNIISLVVFFNAM